MLMLMIMIMMMKMTKMTKIKISSLCVDQFCLVLTNHCLMSSFLLLARLGHLIIMRMGRIKIINDHDNEDDDDEDEKDFLPSQCFNIPSY